MDMLQVPGYLYAKSVLRGGEKQSGYTRYFVHESLLAYLGDIESLQGDFSWSVASDKRHEPVSCYKSIGNGESLAVRFFDEGEDEYHRPHTIRVEALRVNDVDLPRVVDGGCLCVPNVDSAEYTIPESTTKVSGLILTPSWTFVGDVKAFYCRGNGAKDICNAKDKTVYPEVDGDRAGSRHGRRSFKFCALILAIALILVSCYAVWTKLQLDGAMQELSKLQLDLQRGEEHNITLQRQVRKQERLEQNVDKLKGVIGGLELQIKTLESIVREVEDTCPAVKKKVESKGRGILSP